MKSSIALSALAALVAVSGAASAAENPYVLDGFKAYVKDSNKQCVRTGYWTPALAEQFECDGDIAAKSKVVLAADTLFNLNSAALKADGRNMLNELVARIEVLKVEVVMATGYADRLGPAAFNQKISEKRAAAVKAYLVKQGVPADKVQTEGKGTADPVVTCADGADVVACLAPNRRAVIEVVGTRAQ